MSWTSSEPAIESANAEVSRVRSPGSVAAVWRSRRRWIHTAPAVMPNIAALMTKNARWYHIITERSRVSITCSISVLKVRRKSPP